MLNDEKKSFRFRLTDIVALVICLGIAFVLWIYVSSNDVTVSTKTFNHIYIDMTTHNKSGLDILSGADTTVDVTVSGKKSVINKLTKEDISAYTVISENAEANERFECTVYFDPINNVTIIPSASSF
ncbi:MAG: hypothetical protein KBT31_03765, partial [Firmicutes bacterium]|nr:hypothetical protein [Candidatus Colimorpha enterica]